MKKLFAPCEQSMELKELLFDEPCFAVYIDKTLIIEDDWLYSTNQDTFIESSNFTAPLYQQAFTWFREKHQLSSWVYNSDSAEYFYTILFNGRIVKANESLTSHEEAEIACLNKLIEIVKNKYMSDTITLNRRFLVETLENLLTDGFDSSELVHLTNDELVLRIIAAAEFYKSWNE